MSDFTDDQIYRMRQYLARRWNQSISQVTDAEARAYLRAETLVAAERASRDAAGNTRQEEK